MSSPSTPRASPRPRVSNLSDDQRLRVAAALLHEATGGVAPHAAVRAVAVKFGVHARTVKRVWSRAHSNFERNGVYAPPSLMHRTGRLRVDRALQLEQLRGVDPQQRSTIRSAAQVCFLPPTTLFRELRLDKLCVSTSFAKLVPYPVAVNSTSYREMLTEHVLPSILTKFPGATSGRRITVQQDNASPHIQTDDTEWCQAVAASGCNVQLRFQPPNSPDMNVLDLAVFNAVQARQQRMATNTLDESVENVKVAIDELPPASLNAGFLTLQCVMGDCVASGGDNTFKIRHMSKSKLAREGKLPRSIKCSDTTAFFLPVLE